MSEISLQEKTARIQLSRTENVGPVTYTRLMQRFGSAMEALPHLPELATKGGRKKPLHLFPEKNAEKELKTLEKMGGQILVKDDGVYPPFLAEINDAPPVLHVLGDPWLLHQRCVSMVGARNASANGRRFAYRLAGDLGKSDLVVVSGLARGIDTSAHAGAMETGTVAVVAGGVDEIYPPENEDLYDQIKQKGCLVSEMPLGTVAQARHFPRRNRIVAGLSLGTIVVEAASRSGSIITATCAAEQGREVMAVPGSPADPRCQGCNTLIRDGATLIQSAADVMEALSSHRIQHHVNENEPEFLDTPTAAIGESELEETRTIILENLSYTAIGVDELLRECQVSSQGAATVLLELELAGRLQRQPGNRVVLLQSDDFSSSDVA